MITPDTKDWTWVLERPCPECGFDSAALSPPKVAPLLWNNVAEWRRLLDAGRITAVRPDEDTWSPLEYACHVRDVFRRFEQRLGLMLSDDDPLFANWDQDASAVEERYNDQDPATVVQELEAAADVLSTRLGGIDGSDWERPGRRSDGSSFTVASLVRYMIHDPIHHIWDVTLRAG